LPSALQIHNELQLTSIAIEPKEHTESTSSSESKPKTKRSSLIDQHIKRDERESDIAAGFPNGVPKDGAPREEWDRYLYNKVEYFKRKEAERNRFWPRLEAGLKFQRQMSEGVLPGSGEVLPVSAMRRSFKRRASIKVSAPSVMNPNEHGDDSDQDSDAKSKGVTQATTQATTPTNSPAREGGIRNKYNTSDQARTKKRRRVDDLDTNLGEAWDAHVDAMGGRPKRKVRRDI
jgi:hypothetical protein